MAHKGANLQYRGTLGGVSVSANAWAGTETDKDNRMLDQVHCGDKTEETWKGIMDAYLEFGTDWGSLRLVALSNLLACAAQAEPAVVVKPQLNNKAKAEEVKALFLGQTTSLLGGGRSRSGCQERASCARNLWSVMWARTKSNARPSGFS